MKNVFCTIVPVFSQNQYFNCHSLLTYIKAGEAEIQKAIFITRSIAVSYELCDRI